MIKACHPVHNHKITVSEHIREYGHGYLEEWEKARCPVCKQRMNIVAASAVASMGHFAHQRNSGYCPTKSASAAPYRGLPPRLPDPAAAIRIREAFRRNWKKHFYRLDWLVKGLAVEEFFDVIAMADQERIWEYSQLEEFQLPYILATLTDFPPERSFKRPDCSFARKYWFRCWFDATVQRYDDLWIQREGSLMFWRGWYELSVGKRKPGIDDLVDSYELELSADFLTGDREPHPFVVKRVEAWLAYHFPLPQKGTG